MIGSSKLLKLIKIEPAKYDAIYKDEIMTIILHTKIFPRKYFLYSTDITLLLTMINCN